MYWENKGKEVPTRDLIKTPEQIEGIRRAGVVNTGVLDEVAKHIRAGMSTLEIDQICRKYCEERHAIPACLNYGGDEDTPPFPMSVCTSINEVVCHGVPKAEDVLEQLDTLLAQENQLKHQLDDVHKCQEQLFPWGNFDWNTLKELEQYGFNAYFYSCSPKLFQPEWQSQYFATEITDYNKKTYFVAFAKQTPDINAELLQLPEQSLDFYNKEEGHGVGLHFHEEPDVNHYGHRGTGMLLVPGMVFTIEPMINMGTYEVFIDADDPYGWEVISADEQPSAQWEHTLVMTEHGVEILTY